MDNDIIAINEKLAKLTRDMELIKGILLAQNRVDNEGELSDWAKKELERARKTPRSEYISHEEVKKRILNKK